MHPTETALLAFNPELGIPGQQKRLWDGLSAVVSVGNSLWVANDEALSLERLTRQNNVGNGELGYGEHRQFLLHDFLCLPVPPDAAAGGDDKIEEADLEGLDYQDGYLWLIGSHSLKRSKPHKEHSVAKNRKRLAKVSRDGNRFLLARIPLEATTQTLRRTIEQEGCLRTAARLRGDAHGNALTKALADDDHLGPFMNLPSKDNGFDIEGLAVVADRVFVGLRGPVLRGWAVLLELAVHAQDATTLTLKPVGPQGALYRKHFLDLNGLGIRDVCVQGADLLILAGPNQSLAGSMRVFRWPGGARPDQESLVFNEALPKVLDIPFSSDADTGQAQAEGLTLFALDGGEANRILVVYDGGAKDRQRNLHAVVADIFPLPNKVL